MSRIVWWKYKYNAIIKEVTLAFPHWGQAIFYHIDFCVGLAQPSWVFKDWQRKLAEATSMLYGPTSLDSIILLNAKKKNLLDLTKLPTYSTLNS